jgi:carboxymethylenebutenolidase
MAGENIASNGVNGYLVRASTKTGAGILLLPHVTGILQEMRDEAEAFAAEGLTAFVWDPYPGYDAELGREHLPKCSDADSVTSQSLCVDYLQRQLGVERLGLIGWCMGGRMALNLAAKDHRFNAAVAYYPSIRDPRAPEEMDTVSIADQIACPLQVVYPGKDHVCSNKTFYALRAALDRVDQPVNLQVYPGATHGFMGRQEEEVNGIASELAWPQTIAFLRAALLSRAPAATAA